MCADRTRSHPGSPRRLPGLILGPVFAAVVLLAPVPAGMEPAAWRMVALTLWMVVWWLTEALPLPATALLPVVLMPLLDLRDIAETAARYGNPLVFLFLGGFMLAAAMQRVGLHRRIALGIVALVGATPDRIVLGFMLATAFLSMWISNTATAVMMYPVALSVIAHAAQQTQDAGDLRRFGVALMLAVAYSASIGGVATLIGTPPNAMLASFALEEAGTEISFARWMMIGLPVTVILLPLTWVLLTRVLFPARAMRIGDPGATVRAERAALGPMDRGERLVATVFALTAAGWMLRAPLARLTGLPLDDAMIALTAALVLFAVPVLPGGRAALDWGAARDLPWGVLILFGGGLALADGFAVSGLAAWIGGAVAAVEVPVALLVLVVLASMVYLSEIASNTAVTATFLPILAAVARGQGLDMLVLTVPVALGASMGFMLPMATPPNTIVFAWEGMRMSDMVRAGALLNILSIAVIYAVFMALAGPVLGLSF